MHQEKSFNRWMRRFLGSNQTANWFQINKNNVVVVVNVAIALLWVPSNGSGKQRSDIEISVERVKRFIIRWWQKNVMQMNYWNNELWKCLNVHCHKLFTIFVSHLVEFICAWPWWRVYYYEKCLNIFVMLSFGDDSLWHCSYLIQLSVYSKGVEETEKISSPRGCTIQSHTRYTGVVFCA